MKRIVLEEFAGRGVVRGSEVYLRPEDAWDLLQRLDANDVAVVGAEAVVLEPSATIPQPDLIADFSDVSPADWERFRRSCTESCRTYLEQLPEITNLFISLVPLDRWEI